MRGESSESMRWKLFGSVRRAQAKTKPVRMPSAGAKSGSLISGHRLEHERRADRGHHDRHHRDDAGRREEGRSGEAVARGAAAGGAGSDADQDPRAEEERHLAPERQMTVEP